MSVDDTLRREVSTLIGQLQTGLVSLERTPAETETGELFRAVHTLKGSCAMGGRDDAALLAHAVEEFLEAVRTDTVAPTTELIDLALEAIDTIESLVVRTADEESSDTDPASIAETLTTQIETHRTGEQTEPSGPSEKDLDLPAPDGDLSVEDALERASVFDDLDELTAIVDDEGGDETLAGVGTLDDFAEDDPSESSIESTDDDPFVWIADEAPTETDVATLQEDLEEVSFGQFDDEDDLTIQELVEIDPEDDQSSPDDDATPSEDQETAEDPFVWSADPPAATESDVESLQADLEAVSFGLFDDEDDLTIQELVEIDPEDETDTAADEQATDLLDAVTLPADDQDGDSTTFERDPQTAAFADRFSELFETDSSTDSRAVDTIAESSLEMPAGHEAPTDSSEAIRSITIDVDVADELLALAEQLSLVTHSLGETLDANEETVADELHTLQSIETDIVRTVRDLRLLELSTVVDRVPRLVRDIAREQDKQIDVEITGADVTFDRRIAERLSEPLVHLVRNAADHGIESPAQREDAEKPPTGTIAISAERVRDGAVITVEDDGAGIDPEEVTDRAIAEDRLTPSATESMDREDVFALLFEEGFSTAASVTDVSGRGVGMEIVERACSALDGTVEIDSVPGEGTTVRMELPVTTAMAPLLFLTVGTERVAIPVADVAQIAPITSGRAHPEPPYDETPGESYTTCTLTELLDTAEDTGDPTKIVWIRPTIDRLAIECDAVVGAREAVVSPFGPPLDRIPGISGATIDANGDAVTVLDTSTLGR